MPIIRRTNETVVLTHATHLNAREPVISSMHSIANDRGGQRIINDVLWGHERWRLVWLQDETGSRSGTRLDPLRAGVSARRLDESAVRTALSLDERIYPFAYYNDHPSTVMREYGIDAFNAVLVDERLPKAFRMKRQSADEK